MVGRGGNPESLWLAGVAALAMHSLMVFSLALGMAPSEGGLQRTLKNGFCAEVVFDQEIQKGSASTAVAFQRRCTPVTRTKLLKKPAQKRREDGNQHTLPASASPLASAPSGADSSAPLFNPSPIYPLEARRRKVQGVVLIRLSLTETGEVDQARPLTPRSDPVLEGAALKAVYQWRFRPGVKTLEVPIEFKLIA